MKSKFVRAGNIRTHYIEAGEGGNNVILLHGGEYGGSSRNSWEFNIEALAEKFHVYAVDMIGFGSTDKLFSFNDMQDLRINHINDFISALCIESASFIGNSLGGGLILKVASMQHTVWNIEKIITIGGGGPNNPEAHQFMNQYDCTKEYMRKIHDLLFYDDVWKTDEYVDKRYQESIQPGAWEALSVTRLKSPLAQGQKSEAIPEYSQAYADIKVPVLIANGDQDTLKFPDHAEQLSKLIPNSQVKIFKNCRHCAQIECSEEFNRIASDFLS